jgi:hypothetical protein
MLLSHLVSVNYDKVMVIVLKATFDNISVISWRPGLLVEETGVPGENHRSAASHSQTLSYNVVSVHLA